MRRHNGPSDGDVAKMLKVCTKKRGLAFAPNPKHLSPNPALALRRHGAQSLDKLCDDVVPESIRLGRDLDLPPNQGEARTLADFKEMMDKNEVFRSFIGAGYYDTLTPSVILRNLLENPQWYTPYTPYQAEISQGRLEMLLNFQTMVGDLTGLGFANASLLDEATAAAEAVTMCVNLSKKKHTKFFIADDVYPQTVDVVKSRVENYDMDVQFNVKVSDMDFSNQDVAGILIQYPNNSGRLIDYSELIARAEEAGAKVIVASDLLASTVVKPAGEFGAHIVVGNSQRFGVPMGFGGPHAAFFACNPAFMRKMPGRVIGVSRDSRGLPAMRMTMQTREQHIRRDKATSNICTAQALLANTAAAYGIYHGPEGLKKIGSKVQGMARVTGAGVRALGYDIKSDDYFDTIEIDVSSAGRERMPWPPRHRTAA